MARLPRLSIAGLPHHVIQRGLSGRPIFVDDDDRRAYLAALRAAAADCGVAVHAYALLPDEVHLLVTPAEPAALSRMMQKIGRRHVAAINRRHGGRGTLWEGRFRAGVLEPRRYLLPAMQLIETLPVRRGLAAAAADYAWSSASHHLGQRHDAVIAEHAAYWGLGNTPFERELAYRRLMEHALTAVEERKMIDAAEKGWGLGLAESIPAPRRLQPLPRGRPRLQKAVPK